MCIIVHESFRLVWSDWIIIIVLLLYFCLPPVSGQLINDKWVLLSFLTTWSYFLVFCLLLISLLRFHAVNVTPWNKYFQQTLYPLWIALLLPFNHLASSINQHLQLLLLFKMSSKLNVYLLILQVLTLYRLFYGFPRFQSTSLGGRLIGAGLFVYLFDCPFDRLVTYHSIYSLQFTCTCG